MPDQPPRAARRGLRPRLPLAGARPERRRPAPPRACTGERRPVRGEPGRGRSSWSASAAASRRAVLVIDGLMREPGEAGSSLPSAAGAFRPLIQAWQLRPGDPSAGCPRPTSRAVSRRCAGRSPRPSAWRACRSGPPAPIRSPQAAAGGAHPGPSACPTSTPPDGGQIAVLHYLFDTPHGGTSFYRHRSTGFESITPERAEDYAARLRQELEASPPPAAYTTGDTELFEGADPRGGRRASTGPLSTGAACCIPATSIRRATSIPRRRPGGCDAQRLHLLRRGRLLTITVLRGPPAPVGLLARLRRGDRRRRPAPADVLDGPDMGFHLAGMPMDGGMCWAWR